MTNLRERALGLLALEIASDDMGVYPQSISGGEKAYEKRTDWMEGWNACHTALIKKQSKIRKFINKAPERIKDYLLFEKINLSVSGDEIEMFVICNDLFYWGCADGETIEMSDLDDFDQAMKESPNFGPDLWCARKRGMRPQGPFYKSFTSEDAALFDKAGPERTDPCGKKRNK
ncbi:hypothetical protein [Dyadobacter sp. CY356]|uniref:hypothetical protein n=1 Tax=Dyadobacter sp. CY356 TaxID=2906442 RepID=UPI001F3FA384|nr:hypothetical protein [Dyadobacter sp. CY356]MCF0055538.1 hypothetical protein [Dyadobacter sp. CY356]